MTVKLFRVAFIAVFLFIVGTVQAQKITGNVKDANGEAVIGATIMEKGTKNGTVSDVNGNFTLQMSSTAHKLDISCIGMKAQSVDVKGRTSVSVVMKDDDKTLDDVVVIGYGTMKRRDLTGAVASVTGEKLAVNPVANVTEALQGQLPGVSVTTQDGRPGATMSVRVRGGGSITQSNDPLFIVDGVQVSSIDDIPADNIESIDVLKDAASTAIYGARGANGVIMVTTKGATEGRTQIRYNVYMQKKNRPELLDVQDAYNMVRSTWEYATTYNSAHGDDIAKYYGLGSNYGNHLNEYKNVSAHNYCEDILKTSTTWNHDLSISGGTAKTKVYATVNYMKDNGIRKNSGFKRWNANFKISQQINKNLAANFDIRYSEMTLTGNHFDYATSAYTYRPIDNPLGTDDPSILGMGSTNVEAMYNPSTLLDQYYYQRNRQRLRGKADLTWTIIKGLTAKTDLSLSRNWLKSQTWDGGQIQGYNSAELGQGDGYDVRWNTTINYEVQGLGKDHSLSFLAGNEVLSNKSNSSTIKGTHFPEEFTMDNAFGMINANTDKSMDSHTYTIGTPTHTNSWFGRANYSYLGRYLFTATFRADGSSKFAPNNHWGYFPAGAFAWRISDEPFMKAAQETWLDNLKLRLSIGSSGSDNIDASLWKETWTTSEITVDGQKVTTYVPGSMKPNDDLKWETTISRNVGVDFGFLGKIRGSLEVYWNTTKNILMQVPCDASSGYSYQYQNVGKTSNKGIELALAYDIVRQKDWGLSFNMTYNYNHNNVDEVDPNANADTNTSWGSTMRIPSYDYIIREGEPVGTIQGYRSMGYFTVDDFNYDTTTGKYTLKDNVKGVATAGNYPSALLQMNANYDGKNACAFPGAPKFEDADGDGVADIQVIGHTQAKHTGGFNLNANWKGLDFSAGFTYQIGGKVYNANAMRAFMGNKDTWYGSNRLSYVNDAFHYYDIDNSGNLYFVSDATALAALNANTKYCTYYCEYGITSSEWLENASYLRLNTITVGYTLPNYLTQKIGISKCRFYFTGGNLLCLSGYSGLDPDVNTNGYVNGFPTPNYDYNSYPKARTFTFGLNVAF